MEVQLTVQGNMSQDSVKEMFTKAISVAVEVPIASIVKMVAAEIERGSGARRLQSTENKTYKVDFEILVPGHLDAAAIMEKVNRIAASDSAESQVFRQQLMSMPGVLEVGEIVLTTPAYEVRETSVSPDTQKNEDGDDRSWTAIIIVIISVILGCGCLIAGVILVKRSKSSDSPDSSKVCFRGVSPVEP